MNLSNFTMHTWWYLCKQSTKHLCCFTPKISQVGKSLLEFKMSMRCQHPVRMLCEGRVVETYLVWNTSLGPRMRSIPLWPGNSGRWRHGRYLMQVCSTGRRPSHMFQNTPTQPQGYTSDARTTDIHDYGHGHGMLAQPCVGSVLQPYLPGGHFTDCL